MTILSLLIASCGAAAPTSEQLILVIDVNNAARSSFLVEFSQIIDILKNNGKDIFVYFNPQFGYYFVKNEVTMFLPDNGGVVKNTLAVFIPTTRNTLNIYKGNFNLFNLDPRFLPEGWVTITYEEVKGELRSFFNSISAGSITLAEFQTELIAISTQAFGFATETLPTFGLFVMPTDTSQWMYPSDVYPVIE